MLNLKGLLSLFLLGMTLFGAAAHAQDPDDEDDQEYHLAPSSWAIGVRGAFSGFPGAAALGNRYEFYYERILPWQQAGLFSLGAHLGSLPLAGTSFVSENPGPTPGTVYYPNQDRDARNLIGGFQIRYQLKFFPYQILVPTAAFEWDYYRFNHDPPPSFSYSKTGSTSGLSYGIMLNLGWVDEMTSRQAYQNINLTKAYLTAEIRNFSIKAATYSYDSKLWFFGLRTEFE